MAEFLNPPDPTVATSTVVVMDEVLRQDNPRFLELLSNMRNGSLTDDDVDFIVAKCLDAMSPVDAGEFDHALRLVPTWRLATQLVFDYLENNMTTPIAKTTACFDTCRQDGRNCCVKESSMPARSALCVGAKVMLLRNFIVEHKLMNGSVGTVKRICYKNPEGPANPDKTDYVIVEFPNSTIPEEDALIPGMPPTWVPIPLVTERCEKNCCQVCAFPLRVCIALTAHKSQGMTVGPGQAFEKVVVYLPEAGSKSTPGLELVAISRATSPECFAIGNAQSSLSRSAIKKIGATAAYQSRREFEAELRELAQSSQETTIAAIKDLDENENNKTYEGGCKFLLNWFCEITSD